MKKALAIVAGFSAMFAGSSYAADMTVKARPMVAPVAVFSWAGCYIGGNVGYARGDVRTDGLPNAIYQAGIAPAVAADKIQTVVSSDNPNGFTAGGGVGCNYQSGGFVVGAEADVNYTDVRFGRIRGPFNPPAGVPYTWEENFRSNWYATARARAGVVLGERNLLYVTGGAAFADYNWTKALDFPGFAGFRYQGSSSETRVGWVIGAGWEYAFNSNWSTKVEYLHMDFGSTSVTTPTPPVAIAGAAWNYNYRFREDIVRVGLNYRFGGGPVVAKY